MHGRPENISAGVCVFRDLKGAIDTVIESIQLGLPLSRIELLDEVQIQAINKYRKTKHKVAPTLFIEIHGTALSVKEQIETFKNIAITNNILNFDWANGNKEIDMLWSARHDAYLSLIHI